MSPHPTKHPTKHKCVAEGCAVMVPHRMLMCLADWRRVPLDLQRAVTRAYRQSDTAGRAVLSPAYRAAVRAAQQAVVVARARERGQPAPPTVQPDLF